MFSKTQTIKQCILQNATLLECLAGIWKRCNFKFMFVQFLSSLVTCILRKGESKSSYVLFYFFLHKLSKRVPCMFLFIVTIIFVIVIKPKLYPNKEMDLTSLVRLGLKRFHMKRNKNKTSMFWLNFFNMLLWCCSPTLQG